MSSKSYEGQAITVHFDGSKCIHSRNCVLTLPGVFQANVEGPWINPDGAAAEDIAALARTCPSGAITYTRKDDAHQEAAPAVNVARVLENGPVAFVADLAIEGHGKAVRATLCRCGASRNKPFCDGAHKDAEFCATGEPPTSASDALLERGGELTVRPIDDGPLLLNGPVEIIAATGRTINRTTKCALCRCGGSANKPFCDGTHRKIGFKST